MKLVLIRAPFRISFAGGGTDIPAFFRREPGVVISTSINRHVYVTLKERDLIFGRRVELNCSMLGRMDPPSQGSQPVPKYHISYSSTENVNDPSEIKHPIVREALRLLDLPMPLDISTMADIPAGTGLGSSSTFTVALLKALHGLKGREIAPMDLAREAARLEIEVLGRPIGKQDHYAAAVGGFNKMQFFPDGGVKVEPMLDGDTIKKRIFPNLMLFYTGIHRDAAQILTEQQANLESTYGDMLRIKDFALQMERLLRDGFDPVKFGKLLHESWLCKKSLASGISNGQIDEWYTAALDAGAHGGKICGAGGGGFLMLVASPDRHDRIRAALKGIQELRVEYEPSGCGTVLS